MSKLFIFSVIKLSAHLEEEIQLLMSPKKGIATIERDSTEITVYGTKILWKICLNFQEGCEKSKSLLQCIML